MSSGWVDYRHRRKRPGHAACVSPTTSSAASLSSSSRRASPTRPGCVSSPTSPATSRRRLPYLNAEISKGVLRPRPNRSSPIWTATAWCRCSATASGSPRPNDIVDAWASLERVRCLANDVWSRRAEIEPSSEPRRRRRRSRSTSACRARTAASAASRPARRSPGPSGVETSGRPLFAVFSGDRGELRDALLAICAGLGVSSDDGA